MQKKQCLKCKKFKTLKEFSWGSNYCRACETQYTKEFMKILKEGGKDNG